MGHSHDHGESLTGRRLVLSIFLTLAFVAGEAFAGYFAHSLALMSDAGHNFADALALAFSWYGVWIARKPSTSKRTFGYHRVGILAALVNAVSLVVIALLIFWEAIDRFRHPERIGLLQPLFMLQQIAALLAEGVGQAAHETNKVFSHFQVTGENGVDFAKVIKACSSQ